MATTFVKIQTITVGSGGAASVNFTSIPQTYTDLKLFYSFRTDRAGFVADSVGMTFNGLSTNRSYKEGYGTGSGGSGGSAASNGASMMVGYPPCGNTTGSVFGSGVIYIPNYTSSNYKTAVVTQTGENGSATAYCNYVINLWSSTSAINQITFASDYAAYMSQYSVATLYGIK